MAQSENLPEAVREKNNLFDRFISGSHFITMTLLSGLSNALGLKDGARFEDSHRDGKPSRTILVLLRYPKQTADDKGLGHNKHTDIGSLTLLFSEQWGLQVLSPATNRWQFCMPKRDHAIINVGDSLRFLSGHQLHSCVHRVIPITQRQEEHRYSIAYFLRPEDDVKYQDSKGRILTAKEWHDNKYEVFREGHEKQEQDAILTGGMEKSEGLVVV
jgi:isopenicillin N synthase-like dioxygenase